MHPIVSELTLGDFLLHMGELHQAEQFYGIMLQQLVSNDRDDSEKALHYNSIGLLHIDRGDYYAAQILFDQAYAIAKNDRSLKSTTLNNLGLVNLNQGRYNQALKYSQRAKKFNRSTKRSPNILSNIASVFLGKGHFKKAKSSLRHALTIEQKYLPSLHFDLANLYDNLAVIEMRMGEYKESFNLLEKCLNIYRQSLPSNHYLMAHGLNNLGMVHSHLGEFDRAREYYEQALNIQSSSFERTKDQHLLVAMSLNNLATL
jgi:tetratricopeptide (TPR) repeat protein